MDFSFLTWFDSASFIYFSSGLIFNAAVSILWRKKIYKRLGLKVYSAVQRIHLDETPRLGGLIIISLLGLFTYFHAQTQVAGVLKLCLWSMLPLIIVALKEDLFQNVRPILRLAALLSSGLLFVSNFSGPYPNLSGTFLDQFLKYPIAPLFFYPLALTALANGSNLTDGVNGLCAMIFLSILGSLFFLAYQLGDNTIMDLSLIVMILITAFLCFNYPSGQIFLGDLGAYILGFLSGVFTIIFFGRHVDISPWFAVLILIYPTTEVVFSLTRRLYRNQPVFAPDIKHTHIKILFFLREIPVSERLANPAVTPLLTVLWIYPLIVIPWAFKKPLMLTPFILIFFIVYGAIYRALPARKHNAR